MLLGIYMKKAAIAADPRLIAMKGRLQDGGCELYDIHENADVRPETDAVLSVGGDGTFLSASKRVADTGIPVVGVNLGRLGFLSENCPEDVTEALLCGGYEIEDRTLLHAELYGGDVSNATDWPYALNEVTVHRSGAAVLGINVSIDADRLPTYWADGLLVATSSGSTAYSLSIGGPICSPDSKVLIIAPVAPHNLNVRPLVVPETSSVRISIISRDEKVVLTMDNRTMEIDRSTEIAVSMAQFSLKRIRLPKSSFVKALISKLFWGEDIRNNGD